MKLIESGKIVNTHSVYGEVKVQPWSDTPDFLCDFDVIYIDSRPYTVERARVHKFCVLLKLEGIDSVNDAMKLRDKTVSVDREDVELEDGQFFITDLIGLSVIDENGEPLGKICDVLTLPANDVYVIRGAHEYMIPAVSEFIKDTDIDGRVMHVKTIPGMKTEKGGERDDN